LNPEKVTVGDWCDVAWAYLMENTPMMANPFEYRETMWGLLYEGETPRTQAAQPRKPGEKREVRALGRGDAQRLDAMRDQLQALAAAKGVTERRPPMPRPAPEQT